jgi:ectoine hydroxylase-related dioxygenase (phytanoyl-CoA dioxygenase family)
MIIPNNTLNKFEFNKYTPNLNPGDCLLHHPQVIHGSNKNKSNMNRRGVVIRLFGKKTKFNKNKIEFYKNQLKNQTIRLFGKN